MKILQKFGQIKSNLKDFSKDMWGKGILSLTALGLGISSIPIDTLSSINFSLVLLYIFAIALSPISLLAAIAGLEKIRSENEKDNSDFLLSSVKMLAFGFFTMIISILLKSDYSILTYIGSISLLAGAYGMEIFRYKDFNEQLCKIKQQEVNNEEKSINIEKLPLRLNLKEEEKELGLTNYFKK
jgi:hypothetical protein